MKPSIGISRGTLQRLAAPLAVLLLVTACGGGSAAAPSSGTAGGPTGGEVARPSAGPASEPDDGSGTDTDGTPRFDAARPELLVIKTGSLELQVEDVDATIAAAADRIEALGGYVSGSEQFGDGEDVSATITYRIPVAEWGAAIEALRELAIKVVGERTSTDDVTGQVVDLRARIANLQASEQALQAIMTQATKISDVLEVQAELTRVRGEIETATAQKQHLEQQAAYSTLTVYFGLRPEAAVTVAQDKFDPGAEVDRATANLVEILQGLASAGIWFGIVWLPILLVLGIFGLIAWFVVRRIGAARGPGAGAPGPDGRGDPGAPPVAPSESAIS
ncbi:MAG: DUF4349 domain-containing protein [Chloroflexota bacterium]|nr:MAG: DUF4349 domain-containing protein [Chloroflexota bacterium]